MALDGVIPVGFEAVFSEGAFVTSELAEPARDYDRAPSKADPEPQEHAEVLTPGGEVVRLPVWTVEVYDRDSKVKRQQKVVRVKIVSEHRPVPPPPLPGLEEFRPVVFEGMSVKAWVDRNGCKPAGRGRSHFCGAQQGWTLWATGMRSPDEQPAGVSARNGAGRSAASSDD